MSFPRILVSIPHLHVDRPIHFFFLFLCKTDHFKGGDLITQLLFNCQTAAVIKVCWKGCAEIIPAQKVYIFEHHASNRQVFFLLCTTGETLFFPSLSHSSAAFHFAQQHLLWAPTRAQSKKKNLTIKAVLMFGFLGSRADSCARRLTTAGCTFSFCSRFLSVLTSLNLSIFLTPSLSLTIFLLTLPFFSLPVMPWIAVGGLLGLLARFHSAERMRNELAAMRVAWPSVNRGQWWIGWVLWKVCVMQTQDENKEWDNES